ncbi:squalene/phytoene synthase family protein, partial [Staphylococcus haemolyticus]|uniref:squalene/phytoene synthase family protein n=1 Tax=Staphylococcus haemolyticus TaxID=1283 RepID=UPI001642B319
TFQTHDPIITAFPDPPTHFQINFQPLYHLIHTLQPHHHFQIFQTHPPLLHYSYAVAGTVGLLLIPILPTPPSDEAYEYGKQL